MSPVSQEVSSPEKHLKNIRQLTFGGENAEAYFSFDGKKLIFQSTREEWPCDQIYIMNSDGSDVHRVSTGKGRTTCSYFLARREAFYLFLNPLGGRGLPTQTRLLPRLRLVP